MNSPQERVPTSAAAAIDNWQEHIDGKPQFGPPVPPLAPAKLTVALYVAGGRKPYPGCTNFGASLQSATGSGRGAAIAMPARRQA